MRILLDHCVDWRAARLMEGHEVLTAKRMGWDRLRNGDLVSQADASGFDVLVTIDRNFRYQQNLAGRRLTIIVLQASDVRFRGLVPLTPALSAALDSLVPGAFVVIGPEPTA